MSSVPLDERVAEILGDPRIRKITYDLKDDYLALGFDEHAVAEFDSLTTIGAIADALTHVGQLAMLRRLAGAKIRGENYSRAEIVAGRVGGEQSAPRREFD